MSSRVVHFEIPYDDGDRARNFYKAAFDWEIVQLPDMGGYTLVTTGPSGDQGPTEAGFINGGMLARETSTSRHPVVVVDVPSIDDVLDRIPGLGGTVVLSKNAVGEMGFTAYVSDPEGNVVGLWETAT